ncbi:nucleoporin 88 isoform X1 [Octopus bimaculoides]|uniref:nucleoporin 88 isoform X1 n=1 Tax=Octopus bimaculoides TaxID=37653 RepID=UPI00071DCFA4|nr:nucleoporin 88 isoform X1 [Octopus bimaculoides]|eukprot:XP_014780339.1 PREDICTED: nuclear pore complex protein Nup88-like isoform X1 [Octopus bimaculoides]
MSIETTATNSQSCGWRFTLNSHPFCKKLHQQPNTSSKEKTNQAVPTISKGLIAVRDGSLYVWDFNSKQLVHLNLLLLASSTTTNNNSNNNLNGRSKKTDSSVDEQFNQFQVLAPSSDIGFTVEQILFNKTGQYLAIWGQVGISIMQMPQQSGKNAMYGGGKHNLVVRTFPLVERLLVSHADIRLLQVTWHPGSYYDGHLVFLALDNILRICDINEPDKIFQEISLSSSNVSPSMHYSLYSVAIGDAAVSFDFGSITELPCKSRTTSKKTRLVWPIYILRGSGDVLLLYSDITSKSSKFSLLTGPLLVHPPAEDNYGTDACSILCLQTTPPVVVIATNEGKLHHCIVLNEKSGKSTIPDTANSDDSSSLLDLPECNSALSTDLYDQSCLYVYESVELELSLQSHSLRRNIPIEDVFTCPIHLVKDVSCEERYHCFHSAGIHSVSLPWLIHYEEFCNNSLFNEENIPNISQSEKCLVEHVLCTKPLNSSPQFPVLGLGTTTNHLLGKTIIVLTSELEFLTIPLNERYKLPLILSCSTQNSSDAFGSPLKELSKEPFDHQLAKILQRTASTPLLKSGKSADISQEECYMLLIRSTKVFREQYIQKQDLAIEEIKRRMNILTAQKSYQMSELKEMAKSQSTLKDFSQALAEKYELSKEKQDSLLKRLSVLVRKIQSHLPILSDAERDMRKELKNMEVELESLRKELNKTKKKKEYQEHQLSLSKSACPNTVLSSQNLVQIKDILKDQNDDINSLMKSVKDLKLETLS